MKRKHSGLFILAERWGPEDRAECKQVLRYISNSVSKLISAHWHYRFLCRAGKQHADDEVGIKVSAVMNFLILFTILLKQKLQSTFLFVVFIHVEQLHYPRTINQSCYYENIKKFILTGCQHNIILYVYRS